MKSTVRKILCVAIAIVLAVGLLPVSALAADAGTTPPDSLSADSQQQENQQESLCVHGSLSSDCESCKVDDDNGTEGVVNDTEGDNGTEDDNTTCNCKEQCGDTPNEACAVCKEAPDKCSPITGSNEEGTFEGKFETQVNESSDYALKDNTNKTENVEGNDVVTTVDEINKTVTTTKYTGTQADGKATETTVQQYSEDGKNITSETVTTYAEDGSKTSETVTTYAEDGTPTRKMVSSSSDNTTYVCEYEYIDGGFSEEPVKFTAIAYGYDTKNLPCVNNGVTDAYVSKDNYVVYETSETTDTGECVITYTAYTDDTLTTPVTKYYSVGNRDGDSLYTTQLLYDDQGNVTTEYTTSEEYADPDDTSSKITDTTTTYDANGNITSKRVDEAVKTGPYSNTQYQTSTVTTYETKDGKTREVSSTTYKLSGENVADADLTNNTVLSETVTTYAEDGTSTTTKKDYEYDKDGNKTQATIYDTDGEAKYVEKYYDTDSYAAAYEDDKDFEDLDGVTSYTVVYDAKDETTIVKKTANMDSRGYTGTKEVKYSDFTEDELALCDNNTPTKLESFESFYNGSPESSTTTIYTGDEDNDTKYFYQSYYKNGKLSSESKTVGTKADSQTVETKYEYDENGNIKTKNEYEYYNNADTTGGQACYTSQTTTEYTIINGEALPTSVTTYKVTEGSSSSTLTTEKQSTQTLTYDAEGNFTGSETKDANDKTIETVKVTEESTTTTTYDSNGSTETVINADGSSVVTVRDADENTISKTTTSVKSASGKYTVTVEDGSGNVTGKQTYNSDGTVYTPAITDHSTVYTGGAPLYFVSDDDYENFLYVTVDGVVLDKSYYESYAGSIHVKIYQSYLNTLGAGTHTVGIVSTNGTASASFSISAETVAKLSGSSPRTGDSSNLALFSALLLVSFSGLVYIPLTLRKKAK